MEEQNHSDSQQNVKPFAIKKDVNGIETFVQWSELVLRQQVIQGIKNACFDKPSEVQFRVIPQILGSQDRDIICQAKSGMGKTAVFILSILNMLVPEKDGQYLSHHCIVAVNTRQLAHQVYKQFRRLSVGFKHPELRIDSFFGGMPLGECIAVLKRRSSTPHIIIGTLGRLKHLISEKRIITDHVKTFVVDQCDRIVNTEESKKDLEYLLNSTPKQKQILMFSATLPEQVRETCIGLMKNNPIVICMADKKVNLQTLRHFYIKVEQKDKLVRLYNLLDAIPFNQCIIFVNSIDRAMKLTQTLRMQLFNPTCIHSRLPQTERLRCYDLFKSNGSRLMIATDVFGRGIDIEKVNLVVNYDLPGDVDSYMHRAARAGRFGNKGIAISFIRSIKRELHKDTEDEIVLAAIKKQYEVNMEELPKVIDTTQYF